MLFCTYINTPKQNTSDGSDATSSNQSMTTQLQASVKNQSTADKLIPEKVLFRESSCKPPRKPKNSERRSREFLTNTEVEQLMKAAERIGRNGHRDATMILISYRHALRVSNYVHCAGIKLTSPKVFFMSAEKRMEHQVLIHFTDPNYAHCADFNGIIPTALMFLQVKGKDH